MDSSLESGDYYSYIMGTVDGDLITGTDRLILEHASTDVKKMMELGKPKLISVVQRLVNKSIELSQKLEASKSAIHEVKRFLKGSRYYKHVSNKLFKLMCKVEKEKDRKFNGMYVTNSMISTLLIDLNSKQTNLDKVKSIHTWLCGFDNRSPNIFCEIYSYLGTVRKIHREQLTERLCKKVNARAEQLNEMMALLGESRKCVPDYSFVKTLRTELQSGINKLRCQIDAMALGDIRKAAKRIVNIVTDQIEDAEDELDTRVSQIKTYEYETLRKIDEKRKKTLEETEEFARETEKKLSLLQMDYKAGKPLRKNKISMDTYIERCTVLASVKKLEYGRWFGFNVNKTLYTLFYLQGLDYRLMDIDCDTCSKEEFESCLVAIDKVCELTHSKQSFVARLIYTRRFYNIERRDNIYEWERIVYDKTLDCTMQRLRSSKPHIRRVLEDLSFPELYAMPDPPKPMDIKECYTGTIHQTIGTQCTPVATMTERLTEHKVLVDREAKRFSDSIRKRKQLRLSVDSYRSNRHRELPENADDFGYNSIFI